MKLLFLAALRNRRHFLFAGFAFFSLIFLTVGDLMERVSLGFLVNTGTDFFTLFREDEKVSNTVSFQIIEKKWPEIDQENTGKISKKDAARYLASKDTKNPLHWLFKGQSFDCFNLEKNFFFLLSILIFVALFKAIFLFVSRYATQLLSIRITRDLRVQYFEHIQSLPLSFYQQHNLGALSARAVGDAGQIATSLNSFLVNYLQTPFTILSALFGCFWFSWKLSLVIFFGLPLIVFPIIFLTKRIKRVSRQMQKNQESFSSVLLDFLAGIHTIKIFTMEQFSLKKFKEQNDRTAALEMKSAKYSLLTRPVLHLITTFCLAFVIIVGLTVLHMTIAQLIVFCGLLHLFYEPVKKFAEENANIQRGVVAAERMFEVLLLKPSLSDRDGALTLKTFSKHIEFDHVSFQYNQEKNWVLKDLSFIVEKGQTVAIVGPTGAGKSTIVQLLPRLYDIQEGEIRIDGVSLKDFTQQSLREQISYVSQKPFLFYDTIFENIAFGRPFSLQEVQEAAKKAHAHEFIEQLPGQYQFLLAEGGKNLSGGQQQRLAIARALVKKAPILVMDEATSSLDAISESFIKMALKELHGKLTQIFIAHRLSMIEYADKIIYLEKGKKVAEGTKDQLLANTPSFRHMWEHFHSTKAASEESTLLQ